MQLTEASLYARAYAHLLKPAVTDDNEVMAKLLQVLGALLAGAAMLSVIAVVNAGYVYRTECPRAGGTTEREWTYRWNLFIPYIGYSRTGCESHTATRVLLDALGVWKIKDQATSQAVENHSSEHEPALVAAYEAKCVRSGATATACRCVIAELVQRLSPAELEAFAVASKRGVRRFDDFPAPLGEKLRAISVTVERDCGNGA